MPVLTIENQNKKMERLINNMMFIIRLAALREAYELVQVGNYKAAAKALNNYVEMILPCKSEEEKLKNLNNWLLNNKRK